MRLLLIFTGFLLLTVAAADNSTQIDDSTDVAPVDNVLKEEDAPVNRSVTAMPIDPATQSANFIENNDNVNRTVDVNSTENENSTDVVSLNSTVIDESTDEAPIMVNGTLADDNTTDNGPLMTSGFTTEIVDYSPLNSTDNLTNVILVNDGNSTTSILVNGTLTEIGNSTDMAPLNSTLLDEYTDEAPVLVNDTLINGSNSTEIDDSTDVAPVLDNDTRPLPPVANVQSTTKLTPIVFNSTPPNPETNDTFVAKKGLNQKTEEGEESTTTADNSTANQIVIVTICAVLGVLVAIGVGLAVFWMVAKRKKTSTAEDAPLLEGSQTPGKTNRSSGSAESSL